MRQALEAMRCAVPTGKITLADWYKSITALQAALAEPIEPVAWIEHEWAGTGLRKLHFEKRDPTVRDEVVNPVWMPLYTAPPQRKPLTREKAIALWADKSDGPSNGEIVSYCRAIERAHGIV